MINCFFLTVVERKLYTEKELFSQVTESSHEAFQTLFSLYQPRLHRYAFQLMKAADEADEVVQETFVKLWLKRDALLSVEEPDKYIYTVLRNISLDRLRKIARDGRLREEVWKRIDTLSNPTEEQIFAAESDDLVRKAFERLSSHKQTIFRLSRHEGLSHDQIADKLHISRNTVKNQLVSSLRLIREYLANHLAVFILSILFS